MISLPATDSYTPLVLHNALRGTNVSPKYVNGPGIHSREQHSLILAHMHMHMHTDQTGAAKHPEHASTLPHGQ